MVSARNGSVEKLDIDGKTYDIERLDDKLQSKESMVYKVVGGYEGTPAVVKMIVDYWHGSANNIEKEVEFTDRVRNITVFYLQDLIGSPGGPATG